MIETTARHDLPLLAAGQAQKELIHNEALAQLDLIVNAAAQGLQDTPPPAPTPGQCWIAGTSPTGVWAGHPGALACWTANGWRYAEPIDGMRVWLIGQTLWAERIAGAWRVGVSNASEVRIGGAKVVGARQPAIAEPVGGATFDVEARTAIGTILYALRSHGLIAT